MGVGLLEIGEHVGTHFDAPIHWITGRDGEDVASVPATRLVANLAELPATGALIVVAPLKLVNGTGSPARVLAFAPR